VDQQSRFVEPKGKKPIALAVTLVFLLISVILCVMFSSQNIAHKQTQKIEVGLKIFGSLEQALLKTEQLQQLSSKMNGYSLEESNVIRVIGATSLYSLQDLQREVDHLLQQGIEIDQAAFSEQAVGRQYLLLQNLQNQLTALGAGNGTLTPEEQELLNAFATHVEQLHGIIDKFNFAMKDNKNAMIRLAGGFEWIEIGQQLDQYMNQ